MKATQAWRIGRRSVLFALLLALLTAGLVTIGPPQPARATSSPSWWNGTTCDTYHYPGSYPLGASFNGVQACGPGPTQGGTDHAISFGTGAGEYEWECVELVMRYMYLVYGIAPYVVTGGDAYNVVNDYSGSTLTKVTNASGSGNLPTPGDILAFAASTNHPTFGHTAVVTAVNVNGSGNGTVTFMQQNASANGWGSVSVTNYLLGDSITKWLHNPSYSGSPPPSDADGDGVADTSDYCISTPGPANNHGCPLNNVQISGDFDGDGKGDVITISRDDSDNSPYIYWLHSTSTSGSPSVDSPAFLEHLSAPSWNQNNLHWLGGDFNGDGKTDLFVASCDPSTDAVVMYILLSTGTGLSSPTLVKSPSPSSWKCSHLTFLTGDVSGDHKADVIAISRDTDNSPYIYSFNSTSTSTTASLADPTFLEHLSAPSWNMNNLKWAVGDFNDDGYADLFVASGDQTTGAVVMYILPSTGTSLSSPVWVKSPSVSSWQWPLLTFLTGDVSGDGMADVIAISRDTDNSPYIYSFNSTSSGSTMSLADATLLEHLSAPSWNMGNLKWATIDADGGGKTDVFVASGSDTGAVVMYILPSAGTSLGSPVSVFSPSPSDWQWPLLTF